ncbi:MAG: hypothetical protein ACJAZV_001426 [Roseivirga sp.]|jgi:hypothetical protein
MTEPFIFDNINSYFELSQLGANKNDLSKEITQYQLDKVESRFKEIRYINVLKTYLANKQLTISL